MYLVIRRKSVDSISKKSNLFFNIMLIITMIVFVFRNTLLSELDNAFSISFNLLCFFLCIVLFLINYSKTVDTLNLKSIIKNNIVIILYFIIRLFTFVIKGFDFTTFNSIMVEFFLLVIFFRGINFNGNNPKKILYPCMVIITVVCVFFVLRAFYYIVIGNSLFDALLKSLTFNISGSVFDVNPNDPGILVMFVCAFLLSFVEKKNIYIYLFLTSLVAYLLLCGCRSACVGIIAVLISMFIYKKYKNINCNKIMLSMLIFSFIYLMSLFTCTMINRDTIVFTPFEKSWNHYSSTRYMLDKYTILSLEDDCLLGFGSFKYTGEKRYEYLMEHFPQVVDVRLGADANYANKYKSLNAHNGFLDFIAGNGIICLGLFLYFIISKIKNIDDKVCRKYYLPIVFMIVVSNFENTILNIIPFMFFLILLFISCMEHDSLNLDKST